MPEEENTVICSDSINTINTNNAHDEQTAEPLMPTTLAADKVEAIAEEDLEDGEIDDDDEEDDDVVITSATTGTSNIVTPNITNVTATETAAATAAVAAAATPSNVNATAPTTRHNTVTDAALKIPIIDLSHDHTPSPTSGGNNKSEMPTKSRRSKKGQPPADDYMEEVEKLLSNVLKKSGVQPKLPKCLETRQEAKEAEALATGGGGGGGRSTKRRKRKKLREEKEKEKERKEKEKARYTSPEPYKTAPINVDDDEDDFEMLNVVGGSPSSTPVPMYPPPMPYPPYDSADDSYTSYDSDDSLDGDGGDGGGGNDRNNRRRRRHLSKRDRKRERSRRARSRDDGGRGGGAEKRSRRDSTDDKHRQEPRKLELCKFYLMECCAKKDKCSYMHSDFPCKYYYLGMECPNVETCKFMHKAPLSEQLRNILLKHLETAPKEILGNFKRLSRDNAIKMMNQRNEELCKEYKVENTWTTSITLSTGNNNRRGQGGGGGGGGGGGNNNNNNSNNKNKNNNSNNDHTQHLSQIHQQVQKTLQQQQLLQQQQQQQPQQQQQQTPHSNIPSLFDIVVKPPVSLIGSIMDKHRKSRWTELSTASNDDILSSLTTLNNNNNNTNALSAQQLPSHLDLKNLEGIMKAEHIEKLTRLGITNLQEVNQLTIGQLQQVGIDFVEISEVQKKVQSRIENRGGSGANEDVNKLSGIRDVDMRSIPSASTTSSSTPITSTTTTTTNKVASMRNKVEDNSELDKDTNSNSNSSSGGVVRVDYSQYLKDSNLAFDRSDTYDDERDEDEQLVIDDGNLEQEDHFRSTTAATATTMANDTYPISEEPKTSDLATRLGLHLNPYNPFRTNPTDYKKTEEKPITNTNDNYQMLQQQHKQQHQRTERFYVPPVLRGRSRSRTRSRSRSRSRSHTPTRSQSNTPEASDSADNDDESPLKSIKHLPVYERKTMYDFSVAQVEEDERQRTAESAAKADKDMRCLDGGGSILPFQAVTNYTPATEIDASYTSHLPMTYKVHEFILPPSRYGDLRRSLRATTQTADPRVRRILGLPETRATTAALKRSGRKLSNSIASPDAESSPKYYTPPSSAAIASGSASERRIDERRLSSANKAPTSNATSTKSRGDPRLDPRCAAASAAKANEAEKSASGSGGVGSGGNAAVDSVITKIAGLGKMMREKMQNAAWYRDLSSNMKIQYNQELARLITELRRFHQDTSPDKNFNFINCNKKITDHILISLGIFIDENGEVNKIDADPPKQECDGGGGGGAGVGGAGDMNANAEARGDFMQQHDFPNPQFDMPPNAGFGFPSPPFDFRFPPPVYGAGGGGALAGLRTPLGAAAAASGMPPTRLDGPSLLGMPPIGQFNPFGAAPGNFQMGGRGLLDAGAAMNLNGFLNFAQQSMGGQRNFNMDGGHNRRNPNNRRHFI